MRLPRRNVRRVTRLGRAHATRRSWSTSMHGPSFEAGASARSKHRSGSTSGTAVESWEETRHAASPAQAASPTRAHGYLVVLLASGDDLFAGLSSWPREESNLRPQIRSSGRIQTGPDHRDHSACRAVSGCRRRGDLGPSRWVWWPRRGPGNCHRPSPLARRSAVGPTGTPRRRFVEIQVGPRDLANGRRVR